MPAAFAVANFSGASRARLERRHGRAARRARTHPRACGNRARADPRAATPRSAAQFELWYQYATGYNPDLNKSINDTLAQNGTLSAADVDKIYNTFLSAHRASERIDTVGSRVVDEIKQAFGALDAASGSATSYSESLADASEKLAGGGDRDALRVVIERLIAGAREMEANNKKLEARLSASKQESSSFSKIWKRCAPRA
jgi:diguanylate cyclase